MTQHWVEIAENLYIIFDQERTFYANRAGFFIASIEETQH